MLGVWASEAATDVPRGFVDQLAGEVTDRVWTARLEALAAAGSVIDGDEGGGDEGASSPREHERLDAALRHLEQEGFLTRSAFTCCQECGHHDIEQAREELGAQASERHAYAFFHERDAADLTLAEPTLRLAYSYFADHPSVDADLYARARDGDPHAAEQARAVHERLETEVGEAVVAALRAQGLEVEWSGVSTERPLIRLREWSRPLPAG